MEKLLEDLYASHGQPRANCPEEERRVRARRGHFKKTLERGQYRKLQRLLDDTDAIADAMSYANFTKGVKFGVQLMAELFGGEAG